jgi:zinc transport system ATP-binding protein
VSRHPDYLALFGTRAATALAPYTHKHDHVHDAEGRVVHRHDAEEAPSAEGHRHG